MPDPTLNPAQRAAEDARVQVQSCIDEHQSFRLEAGAGAGKTYSLVEALRYVIQKHGADLSRRHQRVACVTYTNVAVDEIQSRVDRHPVIHASTIHAFCWYLIKDFQPFLRSAIPSLAKWPERLQDSPGISTQPVIYDLGYPRIDEKQIQLHHSDVLGLTVKLLDQPKFRDRVVAQFPILFIDEYQDTDKTIADALLRHFVNQPTGLLVGLFGDHWQKIYGTGCGAIEHPQLRGVGKKANFRSVPAIVNVLNRMRPALPQEVVDPEAPGFVGVYHTNGWPGTRGSGQHWEGDLPSDAALAHLNALRSQLEAAGWDFASTTTKILMLTHRVLAAAQGYADIVDVFEYSDSFLKKEDPYIAFLCDVVEPVCDAYARKRFGEMFSLLGSRTPTVGSLDDKVSWAKDLDALLEARGNGTIADVLEHIATTGRPRFPDAVARREQDFASYVLAEGVEEPAAITRTRKLKAIAYRELTALARFIDESTPFATKHGVKGAEFENVLVVFGRGWNQYNFGKFLEWAGPSGAVPAGKEEFFERNRNLFYVACSRPRTRLALLFTQELSAAALATLGVWFGSENIQPLAVGGVPS